MSARQLLKREASKARRDSLEIEFLSHVRAYKLPEPEREFRFHVERKWRADFCWKDARILVEVEGGTCKNGRHNRPLGYQADCEKYNAAAFAGWTVLRYTAAMVRSGEAISQVCALLLQRLSNHDGA